ncbi:tRNA (adenosine(37)-N6)-threonylcarbamoyltransferase complex dimerization subunit type 1 TsaB [Azoarcus communis]|uniref:tRNA (adenosine(37)-N6)-threonylcarbamoyltransferase complex dimerization subunit type 1 TsaB n=1 Tax=Parazoarcus communis TaxID=41977 RepID=UPI001459B95A|nr:tRNA (adenosine(37)-N6)-threonylcarbamoyltransferase complex dimerization subunit type 1 TsaB [Parazoarcus communis]NMG46936.1 tRNA (adenosine(37)-N6)-threonylcarbamoyltransferase complex dimerization subunit type 1 TsaB [Parazoarcus communis]
MNLLALETSCEHASVALHHAGQTRERQLNGHANHSEHILSVIDALFADFGLRASQLDAVAFGSGPGAFTGLRLSCGIAQGLALGADLPVIPVCSLDALALQAGPGHVLVATDARMHEIYHAAYEVFPDSVARLSEPACCPPEYLALPSAGYRVIGSALRAYSDRFSVLLGEHYETGLADAVPLARDVLTLARAAFDRGEVVPAELAAPMYVRDKVALTTAERLARGGRA